MKTTTMIGPLLQGFFVEHLLAHKHVSPRTVSSYRDMFRLLLQFVWNETRIEPSSLRLAALDAPVILSFLDYLEVERRNSVRSRNARLAAIHSFFRWVALCDPESVGLATRVLAIPLKRTDRLLVKALTRAEIDALLAAPERSLWRGRRDYALLLTMYNTGARVSEIIALRQEQVQFGSSTLINLMGKGRKERSIPLWSNTAQVLKTWFHELESTRTPIAFPSHRGRQLSRNGVDYILQHPPASRQSGWLEMPEPDWQTHLAACRAPLDGHASAAIGRRHQSHRSLARAREHRNDSRLHRRRFGDEAAGTRKTGASGSRLVPVQAFR